MISDVTHLHCTTVLQIEGSNTAIPAVMPLMHHCRNAIATLKHSPGYKKRDECLNECLMGRVGSALPEGACVTAMDGWMTGWSLSTRMA